MSKKNKYYFRLKEVIILVLVTSFVVALSTGLIVSKRYENNYYQKSNPKSLTSHASVDRLSEMIKAVSEIEKKINKYNLQKYLNNEFQLFKLKQKIWFISI